MTTPPVLDTRTYRTELEQPSAGGDRWSLYVDGRLIARSEHPMDDVAARAWANSQLGEGVTWLNGRINPTETWYWVANPARPRAHRPTEPGVQGRAWRYSEPGQLSDDACDRVRVGRVVCGVAGHGTPSQHAAG